MATFLSIVEILILGRIVDRKAGHYAPSIGTTGVSVESELLSVRHGFDEGLKQLWGML